MFKLFATGLVATARAVSRLEDRSLISAGSRRTDQPWLIGSHASTNEPTMSMVAILTCAQLRGGPPARGKGPSGRRPRARRLP